MTVQRRAAKIARLTCLEETQRFAVRIEELDWVIEDVAAELKRATLTNGARALKGIKAYTAVMVTASVGDLNRFSSAKPFGRAV